MCEDQTIAAFLTFFFLQEIPEHLICSTLQKSFHNQYFVLFSSIKQDQITRQVKLCEILKEVFREFLK